ncbi:hypothetical protein O181_112211, partial [Austropuccinia psidii MF-1]|nr:hypothetical protein [Austropuccinia psidii MF-1]
SDNVVRPEIIETASTVTSIIPASTVNSEHNNTVIIAKNNKPETIYSELINLDISNPVKKARNLANDQKPAITPKAAPTKVIEAIMAEANQLQKDQRSVKETQTEKLCHSEAGNAFLPSNRADTATRSVSGHILW